MLLENRTIPNAESAWDSWQEVVAHLIVKVSPDASYGAVERTIAKFRGMAIEALKNIVPLQAEPVEPSADGLTDEEREHAHLVKLNDVMRDVLAERDCPDGKRLQAIYNEHFNIDYLTGEVTWAKPTRNDASKGQLAGT